MTDQRCICYGGKGGVGKTTCAAAAGLALADAGHDALVVSTDPAHSLADAYEVDLGAKPREIGSELGLGGGEAPEEPETQDESGEVGSLWAVEVDPGARVERYEALAASLAADLRSAGIKLDDDEIERLFARGAPAGSDEFAALDLLVEYVEDGRWDRLVFDTAPTGHTLRLFDLPAVLGRGLDTLRSLRSQVRRIGDSARRVMLGPLSLATGRRDEPDDLAALQARLERAREILTDPDRTTFRVVTIPESMAIAETERLVDALDDGGVRVDRIVVNRVLADADPDCSRCSSRRRRHERRLAAVRERFPDREVVTVTEAEGEVHGRETLERVADALAAG